MSDPVTAEQLILVATRSCARSPSSARCSRPRRLSSGAGTPFRRWRKAAWCPAHRELGPEASCIHKKHITSENKLTFYTQRFLNAGLIFSILVLGSRSRILDFRSRGFISKRVEAYALKIRTAEQQALFRNPRIGNILQHFGF